MSASIGRNDPCYCGSGKKYKKCCLVCSPTFTTKGVIDFGQHQLRQLEGRIYEKHLIPYATNTLPNRLMESAMAEILPEYVPEAMDELLIFMDFFIPFVLFNWVPEDDFGLAGFNGEATLAQNYVNTHSSALNRQERRFIDAMNQTYYSLYTVLEVTLSETLRVKDLLLGTIHQVKAKQGTHQLARGDIVYSRMVTLDKQSIFIGTFPYVLPAACYTDIIDFKQWLTETYDNQSLTPESLRNTYTLALLDYFLESITAASHRPPPTLLNTDDELVVFSTSHCTLTLPPEEALERLLPLTLSKHPDDFLDDAQRDASGAIQRIEFPWLKQGNKKHSTWENTVMGHIVVEAGKLTLETNSAQRTAQGKKLLKKHLGDAIVFQHTLLESPEEKMRSLPAPSLESQKAHETLMTEPEVQAQLNAMTQAHWEDWFDVPIPALDDPTPREAAKTEAGRERLEALLLYYERSNSEKSNPLRADVAYLRSALALEQT